MSGTEALVTTLGIFSANKGVIPAFTPLMQEDATGALVVWDGTSAGKAVYVSAVQIDTEPPRESWRLNSLRKR
ncbi:bacteriophage lambda head decoration D domain protein [Escherichia coli DEC13B]|nr:bacteriophage lambda head decoration D domain protein [Escherichia coli DEC13A]EHX64065.1 bacteriophage lambda head decoration D domain protein [Escherichia coli DEC13B]